MNEYSNLSDFFDKEWEESDHEEYGREGEDEVRCNVDEDKVESKSIKNKYFLVGWAQVEFY